MGACVCFTEHLYLTLEEIVLVTGCGVVGHGLVHLVSGIDDHLHVFLLHVFLSELSNLLVGNQLATCKDGLRQLCDRIQ